MLSRKYYVMLAKLIALVDDDDVREQQTKEFVKELRRDNDRFNEDIFRSAIADERAREVA